MGSVSRLRMARALWVVLAAIACASATSGAQDTEDVSESPITAVPSISFVSDTTVTATADDTPATVGPTTDTSDVDGDLTPVPAPPPVVANVPTSTNMFGLVLSPSSNEAVDLLEIVRNNDATAPRISFESMTDKLAWDVNKWEDPLTQLANMISNEHIAVATDSLRLDVKLSDPANATNVTFAKKNEWQFGPTLVLSDAALDGLPNLKNLVFSNFNISFQGLNWLPTASSLDTLSFNKSTIATFNVSEDHIISSVSWQNSVIDSFPTALLSLKTPPSALSVEACTFSQPLVLTANQLERLRNIPTVTFSQNTFPDMTSSSGCTTTTSFQSQTICVTTGSEQSATSTSQSTTANRDDLPETKALDVSKSSASSSDSMFNTLIVVACAVGGIAIVVGFVVVRRRNNTASGSSQQEQLTFTNHNDKFLGDDDEMLSPQARDTGLSARTTTATTAAGGILNDVDLGSQVIRSDGRLGTNGLFRAEYQGETVVALRVNVGNLDLQNKNIELIVASCVELRHPYVVEFIGTSLTGADDIWLVAEMMAKGSLRSVILKKKIEFTWEKVQAMSLRIASALAYVQSVRSPSALVTPTLSSRSVLCDADWNCKLDVFEFAEPSRDYVAPKRSFGQGEIAYRAPEVLANPNVLQLPSGEAAIAEVYALGVIFCELSLQNLIFSDIYEEQGVTMGEMHVVREVLANRLRPEPAADTPSEYADIIAACLVSDPAQRPSVMQVVDWLNTLS